ncbi:MAG: pitrilysin family protein [Candidatus Zixiibacteriota bacterium]
MKLIQKLSFAAVALLLVLAISSAAQDVTKIKYPSLGQLPNPKIDTVTLDNGIRLYLVEDKSLPVFNMAVRINGGSYLEPAEKVGLAGVCGDVLRTGGTEKWTGDQIDSILEGVGGSVETSIGLMNGSASVNVLSDFTDLGIEVLAQVLRHPVFNQDKIDLSKVGERSEISRRNDNPMQIARREFTKVIYGPESVYARQTEYKTIDGITRNDLVTFHQIVFHPENVQMAIWGDFDRATIVDKIKQYFGDWKKGNMPLPPLPKVEYQWRNKVYFINNNDVNQSTVLIGHIGGLLQDEDYPARIVMNNIFGASFGSRLFNAVRSKEGLAYSAGGSYTANITYPGVFIASTSTKSETTAKALLEVINQIKGMQTIPPTVQEMGLGKDSYLNSFVFNFDDQAKVVNRLMNYDFFGLPKDFLQKQFEAVQKVTPADVTAAAKKNLHPDSLVILVVGKGSDFDQPLDKIGRGPVDTIDITIPSAEVKKELAITPEALAKGKQIIDKAVKVHGTLANFKKVKSISFVGNYVISTGQGDMSIGIEGLDQFPDRQKRVMNIFGRKMAEVRDGKAGWKTDRTGQLVAKDENDIKDDEKETSRSPLLIFRESDKPSYQAVYDGSGDLGSVKVDWVAIVGADGETSCRLAFNTANGQLAGRSYFGQTQMGEATIEEVYSDLKLVSGIQWPMNSVNSANGKRLATMTYTTFTINPVLAPDSFAKPKE